MSKLGTAKMVVRHNVFGYDNFVEYMKKFKPNDVVHVMFSGSKNENGESWCTYCNRALPVIEKELEKADPDSHFVYCIVGDKPVWREKDCGFRVDSRTKLVVLPTLVRWLQPQRLEGEMCEKADLVEMLFTDD